MVKIQQCIQRWRKYMINLLDWNPVDGYSERLVDAVVQTRLRILTQVLKGYDRW